VTPAEPRCHDQDVISEAPSGHALISHVQDWAFEHTVPLNASIEVTTRCNIRCLHCYNFDRDEARAPCATPELSTVEILRVMDELRAAGCLFLNLTGGEVLSHPDLFTFLDHARDLNFAVQLLTNGTMLRPGVAARIAAYPNLQGASVSLYGATPEVHDGITQMPGSWRRTWDGIRRLKALGVTVRLKFIVMKQNAHEVEAMRRGAEGFAYLVDLTITSRHDGSTGSLATRVDRTQLEGLYRGPLRDLAMLVPRAPTEGNLACNCARGNLAVTATGDVHPCVSVPWKAGNVREQSIAEIWKTSTVFEQIRGFKLADYKQCAPCDHKAHCGRGRGPAFTASGSYTGVDPFVCATAEVSHQLADEVADKVANGAATAPTAAPPVRARLAVVR
jgi:radical SAM protein with 4Fe4S-binding SPASM domain